MLTDRSIIIDSISMIVVAVRWTDTLWMKRWQRAELDQVFSSPFGIMIYDHVTEKIRIVVGPTGRLKQTLLNTMVYHDHHDGDGEVYLDLYRVVGVVNSVWQTDRQNIAT